MDAAYLSGGGGAVAGFDTNAAAHLLALIICAVVFNCICVLPTLHGSALGAKRQSGHGAGPEAELRIGGVIEGGAAHREQLGLVRAARRLNW